MCYRYSVKATTKDLEARYNASAPQLEAFDKVHHTNGFSHGSMPVITQHSPNEIQLYSWGLVPFWQKDYSKALASRKNTLNAKCETVFDLSSFRSAIKTDRCLIPATGIFEHRHVGKDKIPFFIRVKSQEIFSMAGLSQKAVFMDTFGKQVTLTTFSIITTGANSLMAIIHNSAQRMPVILDKSQEELWLSNELPKDDIEALMQPYNSDDMDAHPVSKLLTSTKLNANVEEVYAKCIYPDLNLQL